jgi:glycosyltransferase involved in cell wall biosynthesis
VADGGSRDATAARAKAAGAEVIDAGRGYGRACLAATIAAEDADIVVFMDGDGADDADSIGRLVEPIRSGRYDFVIASRARGNREPEASPGTSSRPGGSPVGACGFFTACVIRTCAPCVRSGATRSCNLECAS